MRPGIYTLLSMVLTLPLSAAQEITTEEAISRLESYGLIRPGSEEITNGMDLIWHMRKLKNGDEEINDFPWLIQILLQDKSDNHVPVSCVKPFVEAGATLKGDGNCTALSLAALQANWKMMHYLIEAGADIHEKYDGKLMADIILGATDEATHLSKNAEEIIMLLIDRGYKVSTEEFTEIAGYPGTAKVMKRLIEAGVPASYGVCLNALNGMNAEGVALLHEIGYIIPESEIDETGLKEEAVTFYPNTLSSVIKIIRRKHTKLTSQHETLLREMLAVPFIRAHTDGETLRSALHTATGEACSREFRSFIDELYPPPQEEEEEEVYDEDVEVYDEEEQDDE